MKKSELKEIIREELNKALNEDNDLNTEIDRLVDERYGGDPEVKEAAHDWAQAQMLKISAGPQYAAREIQSYWNHYGRDLGNAGMDVGNEALGR